MFKKLLTAVSVLLLTLGTLVLSSTPARAQFTDINFRVDTVSAFPGDTAVRVPVFFTTAVDEVSTFSLWFRLDGPDIASLRLALDTTGTLVSGWPTLTLQSIAGAGTDIRVTGICDDAPIAPGTGLLPGATDSVLFYLIVDMLHIPDFALGGRKSVVEPVTSNLIYFSLGDWQGNTIGIVPYEFVDTAYFRCSVWFPGPDSICLNWERVALPPYDSILVFVDTAAVLDTIAVKVHDGLVMANCGDITGDGRINLTDVTVMVNFLFLGADQPEIKWIGNVNGSLDNLVNLTDLTRLVNFLFASGPPLECHHPNDD